MEMKNILNRMLNHEELTRDETKNIILGITQSEFPEEQITALLTGLQMRGVTVDELLGFRDGILETGVPAILNCDRYIDVVGTGGDRKNTFNISTTSCFVIAGAGYKVAKHGNFAATSVSGASNVIKNHGVQFTDDLDKLNRSLEEAGIVYLHAQLFWICLPSPSSPGIRSKRQPEYNILQKTKSSFYVCVYAVTYKYPFTLFCSCFSICSSCICSLCFNFNFHLQHFYQEV